MREYICYFIKQSLSGKARRVHLSFGQYSEQAAMIAISTFLKGLIRWLLVLNVVIHFQYCISSIIGVDSQFSLSFSDDEYEHAI
jgi:hypothetical protein